MPRQRRDSSRGLAIGIAIGLALWLCLGLGIELDRPSRLVSSRRQRGCRRSCSRRLRLSLRLRLTLVIILDLDLDLVVDVVRRRCCCDCLNLSGRLNDRLPHSVHCVP